MRTLLSLVVLVAGLAVLGFWAMVDAAPAIEAKIARDALALVDGKARHGMDISVSGRDITLSGLAHTKDERRKFLDRLNSVIGVRMVIDRSDVLAAARPYVFDIHKDGDVLRAKGFVPDAASGQPAGDIPGRHGSGNFGRLRRAERGLAPGGYLGERGVGCPEIRAGQHHPKGYSDYRHGGKPRYRGQCRGHRQGHPDRV